MPTKPQILRSQRRIIGDFSVVNTDAAGIDAGSEFHYVSVPEDRDAEPVQRFATFTEDLHRLAQWLRRCGITTVAIEATGVYWMPLYDILEEYGLAPQLVDSRAIGRRNKKTDVLDCQWIRQLHTFGLLDAAFRPQADILKLRVFARHREMLVKYAADHLRHMHKSLEQMNVKLGVVLSDIGGVTGQRIIKAIIGGHTDPASLAELREESCKATPEEFVKALTGTYRPEHIFTLGQAVRLFEEYQEQIRECDLEQEKVLASFQPASVEVPAPAKTTKKKRRKNQPHFDARALLYRITGIDLTAVPGLEANTLLTIVSEVGTNMSLWTSGDAFANWLALPPNNRITGGKPINKKLRPITPNRAAQAFRLAAQTLERTQTALGAFFRRIQSRIGRQGAIRATAHKLAKIVYAMLRDKTEYREAGANYYEQRYQQKVFNSISRKALQLGYQLVAIDQVH
jgi:transposase